MLTHSSNPATVADTRTWVPAGCRCGSHHVRSVQPMGWERALCLLLVMPYQCDECNKRRLRFVPIDKWISPHWATVEAKQFQAWLRVKRAATEANRRQDGEFEHRRRTAIESFAASTEHAVGRFNRAFRKSQGIALEFMRIPDGFVLKKDFDVVVHAEVKIDTWSDTVRFSITKDGSTEVRDAAVKIDRDGRIGFELQGLLPAEDTVIALFHYVLDKKSNESAWLTAPQNLQRSQSIEQWSSSCRTEGSEDPALPDPVPDAWIRTDPIGELPPHQARRRVHSFNDELL